MTDSPVACTLDPTSFQAGRDASLPGLARKAIARSALQEGLRLTFAPSPEATVAIARVIEAERHCCEFHRFQLTTEPGSGPVVLEVSGPAGTGAFLEQLLAAT